VDLTCAEGGDEEDEGCSPEECGHPERCFLQQAESRSELQNGSEQTFGGWMV